MKPKIILFGGFAQNGKDASATITKNYFEQFNKTCLTIRYGDYLKFIASNYYGWNGVKDDYGRTLLQTLGTEEARDFSPDIWVNVVIEFVKAFGHKYDYVLIPDFRYPNECTRWIEEGFDVFSIWVHRNNFDNGLTKKQKEHRSETSLLNFSFDRIIMAENNIQDLTLRVIDTVRNL